MLERHLERHFTFAQFRSGQKEIIEAILDGSDVVALMPTGGGKSLCYQLPALLHENLTIVISPLIALMKDQVDGLVARGIAATFINSSLDANELKSRMEAVREGRIKILYVAPERFNNSAFRELLGTIDVALLAIDEAHCVSQWGHDFRPEYLAIGECIALFKKRPTVTAFTATATEEVKNDIIKRLHLREPKVFIRGFDRPNIHFFVERDLKPLERQREMLRLIESLRQNGSGVVYTLSRKEAEKNALYLRQNGITARAYHAGMSASDREKTQNDFMENRFQVIVATVAFGMGVDKADIRFVIHSGMPGSVEGYYQEAGRAGRDGERAYCILLHSKRDVTMHRYFLNIDRSTMHEQGKSTAEIERLLAIKENRLSKMMAYTFATDCRRRIILHYFSDPAASDEATNCKGCDICLNWKNTNLPKQRSRRSLAKKDASELGGTVLETVRLYEQHYSPEKIAKMRSLGLSTIFGHIIEWYMVGGDLCVDDFLSAEEEALILPAIEQAKRERPGSLSAMKEKLPDSIGYEKIKLVLAKQKRKL